MRCQGGKRGFFGPGGFRASHSPQLARQQACARLSVGSRGVARVVGAKRRIGRKCPEKPGVPWPVGRRIASLPCRAWPEGMLPACTSARHVAPPTRERACSPGHVAERLSCCPSRGGPGPDMRPAAWPRLREGGGRAPTRPLTPGYVSPPYFYSVGSPPPPVFLHRTDSALHGHYVQRFVR